MAFIDKKDPVVLNIKLTSKGRELLSEGNLNFTYYAVGDSEMDYVFNAEAKALNSNYSPFFAHILRPADKNPNILSFISRNLSGDPYNVIPTVPSTPSIIQNTAPALGFFTINTGSTTFITDTDHVKQPDVMVKISGVTGGRIITLNQAPTYIANVNEPSIGDLLLIKWTNPLGISTTGYTVNKDYPTPYLIYKIQDISGGTLASNNLVVQVDRELPDFSSIIGGSNNIVAGALVYYNYINYTGSSIFNDFSTDYVNEAVLTFLQNCQCPTITFPFWNMSIIYTDEMAGVQSSGRTFAQYNSNLYGGFVSYIQNQAPVIKKLGVIHYTNSSPSNTYGEELYQNTPTLTLPTIMWHKSADKKMGLVLKAYGSAKTLTGATVSLNTDYYDLADLQGNVVGKVFNDLQIFVIEDQELLFAMSYKSNRSWTLPDYAVGINDNVVIGCQNNAITFDLSGITPSTIGGMDGSITIYNIDGYSNIANMVLQVLSGNTSIFYGPITGTTVLNNVSAGVSGGTGITYTARIYDLATVNIPVATETIILIPVTSRLRVYGGGPTASGLDPDFAIVQISPTMIRINRSAIGTYVGTPSAAYKPYGILPLSGDWQPFVLAQVNFNSLTFTSPYSIYVRDSGATFNFMVQKGYVAAGTPLNSPFSTSQGSDTGGTYVQVSNYIKTITPSNNPVVGVIELSIYPSTSVPTTWTAGGTTTPGSAKKLYVNSTGTYKVSVRERYNNIVMYTITQTVIVV